MCYPFLGVLRRKHGQLRAASRSTAMNTFDWALPTPLQETLPPTPDFYEHDPFQWAEPRNRRRLKNIRRKRHQRERYRQESRTYSAFVRCPATDDPMARSIVEQLNECRSVEEAGWVLDFELHRWFGHRHNSRRFGASGDCSCCDISEWLYPESQRFLKGHG